MKILAIMWKDFILRFSDRAELLFFLVLPMAFIFLLSGGSPDGATAAIPVLVVDEDGSRLSEEFYLALSGSDVIKPALVSLSEAEKQFAERKAPALVIIPAGFEAELLNGAEGRLEIERTPNNNHADTAERVVWSAASTVSNMLGLVNARLVEAEHRGAIATEADREAFFTTSLEAIREANKTAPSRVQVTMPETLNASEYDPKAQASIGQLITWVFIPLVGTSGLLAMERNQKTLQRLVTTPTRKATFLLGTVSGQLAVAIVQMAILIGFGALALNVRWGSSPAGLAAMMVSFGLASVALGTMLGTFVKTEKQANNLSITIGMVMALLGGCWWPLELFPSFMRSAANILPVTWAMQGFSGLVMRGQGLAQIMPQAAVLLGFALVFFLVGVKRFRYE